MSTTFDKLAYLETLKASGITDDAARAHANALDDALRETVATKGHLRETELRLKLWSTSLAGIIIAALAGIRYFG